MVREADVVSHLAASGMNENPYKSPSTDTRKHSGSWFLVVESDAEQVGIRIERFFSRNGYRLESGNHADGYYGIGSDLRRIFLGAFAKRYKFRVMVESTSDGTLIIVAKAMSGAMGGAIGYAKMKKELHRVRSEIEALFR